MTKWPSNATGAPRPRRWRQLIRAVYDSVYVPYLYLVCAPVAVLQVYFARRRGPINRCDSNSPLVARGPVKEILVIVLDHLGDTAVAVPLILQMRRTWPKAQFTLVTRSGTAGLFEGWSNCRVLVAEDRGGKLQRWLLAPRTRREFARQNFSGRRFDLCVVPRFDADYQGAVLLGYFSGAARRVSFSEKVTPAKSLHNRNFDRLLTTAVGPVSGHESQRISQLFSAFAPEVAPAKMTFTAPDPEWARATLAEGRRWIAICPSEGSSPLKQWGPQRWTAVAVALAQLGFAVVLVGGPGDQPVANLLEAALGRDCLNLVGRTSLGQLASVLERCELYLGNDCGPMHVACALGRPAIAIMGSTCSHRYGPWSEHGVAVRREIACSPCADHRRDRCRLCVYRVPACLSTVSPQEVIAAAFRATRSGEQPDRGSIPTGVAAN